MMDLEQYAQPASVQAIYEYYKTTRKSAHRPHLGGSQIGQECSRALWYQFRHADEPHHEGRILRLFETGDREEARIIENLRAIGITVWDRDPDTGRQIRYTACDGHFALSLDGVVQGLKESGQPHTLEIKTMNDKNFKALQKDGVERSKPVYWAQCQVGMHLADLDRCLFVAVNKNDDQIYMERIRRDLTAGLQLVAKAEAIIFAEKPPSRISNDPSFFVCKTCVYKDVCHNGKPPLVNCRTCAHATPERGGDGAWSCAKGRDMTPCEQHLFNPHTLAWEITDAGDDWIEYTTSEGEVIRNHEGNSNDIAGKWIPF